MAAIYNAMTRKKDSDRVLTWTDFFKPRSPQVRAESSRSRLMAQWQSSNKVFLASQGIKTDG